ncbi:MAG: MmgE/PrpD family protein [Vicinamibacteria bacterium]|nr:MmgE/PrpD family protein [Vicinamibacteria bacterium]
MTDRTVSQALALFAADVRRDTLPDAVAASVRERLLDTVGLCLGATPLETSGMARRVAQAWGGPGESTVIGAAGRLPALGAGFVNGVLAHSLDFDDTHLPSVLHPSASIIPGVLAVAEQTGASLAEAMAAAAVGYEVCVRTGMAAYDRSLGNSVFFERGWHATSICGTLGVAAAAGKLMGLDAEGIGHALGIAVSMGSGVIEGNRAGGSVKRLHCGWAVHAGIVAAQCARAGITGPPTAFEGRFAFYQAFCGGMASPGEIESGLGTSWCIPEIFYKPYPANHFTHTAIDAALSLRKRVAPAEVASVRIGVATPTVRTIGEPRQQKTRPQSGYHGQFSGPFAFAAAFLGGGGLGVALEDFSDENVRDERYLSLAARVEIVGDAECDAIFPNQFPAIVRLTTMNGEVLEERVMSNRGGPARPLSRDELLVKFRGNARRVLAEREVDDLGEAILSMEESRKVLEVMSLAGTPSI